MLINSIGITTHRLTSNNDWNCIIFYYFEMKTSDNQTANMRMYVSNCRMTYRTIAAFELVVRLFARARVFVRICVHLQWAVLCSDHITVNSLMIKVFIHTHTSTDKDRVKIVRVCLCVCHTCICHAIAAWTIVLIRTFNLIFFDESVK